MKRSWASFLVLLLAVLQSSCGLYMERPMDWQDRVRQKMAELDQRDRQMDAELEKLTGDIKLRSYPSNVARWEDYSHSMRAIYAKYGQKIDVLNELLLSYITALASHLDRGTISIEEFKYLRGV